MTTIILSDKVTRRAGSSAAFNAMKVIIVCCIEFNPNSDIPYRSASRNIRVQKKNGFVELTKNLVGYRSEKRNFIGLTK